MHHVRVGVYKFKPGTTDTIVAKAEAELLPLHRQQPGFVGYEVVRTGTDSVVSISTWETEAEAEDAAKRSVAWVNENIRGAIDTVENHIGELAFLGR
jgi:heme-degrading monooxygenase HmoA